MEGNQKKMRNAVGVEIRCDRPAVDGTGSLPRAKELRDFLKRKQTNRKVAGGVPLSNLRHFVCAEPRAAA